MLASACTGSEAPVTTITFPESSTTAPVVDDQSLGPTAPPLRRPATADFIYFVMTDRFENGDPSNDTGGVEGDPLTTGFLPEDTGYYHGGDLAGLTDRLTYLADLGVDAIWMTPPFTNRWVQGNGTIEGSSAGYHGYWQTNWDQIDPHLGTEAEMQSLIEAAHDLDLKIYFDIVINHTGDVITYLDGSFVYFSQNADPYLTADGSAFHLDEVAGGEFPALDPATSFPHLPGFANEADATIKSPAWLNDLTLYHNRGNSTFEGESAELGDFFGLDDLFTEHPRVVEGMIELYSAMIARYGIDGFRIDTMKHVDLGFWRRFAPAIRDAANAAGKEEFFAFGEVFATDEILQSSYTNVGVDATLDFILAAALEQYVAQGRGAEVLGDAFDRDDWFTDEDGNASLQVKFFGNHDMGRMGLQIAQANPSASEEDLLARMRLGLDLLFLTRGVPVVYYGDEQGFVGDGGDQLARQSMFPSLVPEYNDDDNIGTDATPADDNFDQGHPLYEHIAALDRLREEHPTLVTGAQTTLLSQGPIFAFSRFDREERIEYVVASNNAALTVPTSIFVVTPEVSFEPIWGGIDSVSSDQAGELSFEIPPLSTVVLRATAAAGFPDSSPEVTIVRPEGQEIPTFRYRLEAELADQRYAEVTFAVAIDGTEPVVVGVDDAPPYRVYWDNDTVPTGAMVEVIVTVDDGSGRLRSDVRTVTMGDRS